MVKIVSSTKRLFSLLGLMTLMISCSHKYDSDVLDLSFYQWNQWPDREAGYNQDSLKAQSEEVSALSPNPPSCGWEALHRGNGNLVRIPAAIEDFSGISWYHCRFTLPELWQEKQIVFMFEAAGPGVEVYLNESLVGTHQGNHIPFDIDVTNQIYYTLDNHLAIRISDPEGGGGIGNILVKSSELLAH
ncbi:MAG: sugar-binding domain-containing protein [Bacteroidota bacterium]